jgi:hypothetical protein
MCKKTEHLTDEPTPPQSSDGGYREGRQYGDCYQASYNSAEELSTIKAEVERGNPDFDKLRAIYDRLSLQEEIAIVHGKVVPATGLDKGRELHHAWVEVASKVIETSNGQLISTPVSKYYADFGAEPIKRYTLAEATELRDKYQIYGLWHTMS